MGKKKTQNIESNVPAIDTKNLPWHKDYHDAGKYKPETEVLAAPETEENNDEEKETLNINNNGTKEEEVS